MNAADSLLIPREVLAFALQIALGATLVAALALALDWCVRRRAEPVRYGVLFMGLIALLAVPTLVAVGLVSRQVLPWPEKSAEVEVVKVPVERMHEMLAAPAVESEDDTTEAALDSAQLFGTTLLSLWLLGMMFGVRRMCTGLWQHQRLLVGGPWQPSFWTDEIRTRLARKLELSAFPAVRVSPVAPMPMVIGLWRPTIIVPAAAPPSWHQAQWEAVLLHEAAHIARRDPWAVLAQHFALVLFWWCPLVYVLARRLNQLRENICDECALGATCDPIAYAEMLVESAEQFLRVKAQPVPLGLLDSARGGLEARVTRLLRKERSTMTRLSLPGKVLGAGLLVTACLLTAAGTAFSGGQAPQKKIQIKIIVDGKEIDLNDAQIWEIVGRAQQHKPAPETKADPAQKPAKVGETKVTETWVKELAFSPDGRVLATSDGTKVIVRDAGSGKIIAEYAHGVGGHPAKEMKVIVLVEDGKMILKDAATGKVIAQVDQSKSVRERVTQVVQSKADPRIEELVKQAEAIRPGSGALVRQALQPAGDTKKAVRWLIQQQGEGHRAEEPKKQGEQSKKEPENLRFEFQFDTEKQKELFKALQNLPNLQFRYKDEKAKPAESRPAANKVAPSPNDMEAVMRQIERITVELNELRRRIESGKK
jgi:beta-lactamase regulating signal transducer with metallopeptidase domain